MSITVYILIAIVYLILDYYIAKWFSEAAEAKGYRDSKYFWICFFFGFIGYLLVIALPDRNQRSADIDELPNELPTL